MSSRVIFCSLFLFLLTAGSNLSADVIDSYQAIQGPFTVGPGETITDEQSVVYSDDILGGFRASSPGVDDLASAGSTASMASGGGAFTCAFVFRMTATRTMLADVSACTIAMKARSST